MLSLWLQGGGEDSLVCSKIDPWPGQSQVLAAAPFQTWALDSDRGLRAASVPLSALPP